MILKISYSIALDRSLTSTSRSTSVLIASIFYMNVVYKFIINVFIFIIILNYKMCE